MNPSLFQATLNTLAEPLLVIDERGHALAINRAWQQLQRRLVTRKVQLEPTHETAYEVLCSGLLSKEAVRSVQSVLDGTLPQYATTCTYMLGHDTRFLSLTVTALEPDHRGAVLTYRDLTEQTRREADLFLANLDPLTGLLNRRLFFAEATRVLTLAERRHQPFTLLCLDLDGFKTVNDSSGYEVGDKVLCEVALRLKGLARRSDLVARFGGDEFLLLLPKTTERESLVVVERFLAGFERPFQVGDGSVTLGGSFGLAHYPVHGQTIDDLIRLADEAMYLAKARGGGAQVALIEAPPVSTYP